MRLKRVPTPSPSDGGSSTAAIAVPHPFPTPSSDIPVDIESATPPVAVPPRPSPPPQPQRVQPQRPAPRRISLDPTLVSTGVYRVLEIIVALGLLGGAALLWYWDGGFTIAFLERQAPRFTQWGIWRWCVPVFFTAVTIGAWPHRDVRERVRDLYGKWEASQSDAAWAKYDRLRRAVRVRWGIVVSVVLVNIGTSFFGLLPWLSKRSLDLFTGWTFPETGWGLYAPAVVISIILAFGPEKIGRWAGDQLIHLIRF